MPSHPPDTDFYNFDNETYTLWRDVSRLWEDWAPIESPQRKERFKKVLNDIIEKLDAASSNV
jgi:hypothetical protein